METHRTLKGFLETSKLGDRYRWVLRPNKFETFILDNGYRKNFAKEIVKKVKGTHDLIAMETMIRPLPVTSWGQMERKISKRMKDRKQGEKVTFILYFNLDFCNDISIDFETVIN